MLLNDRQPTPGKIALFRPLQFGDLMCVVPALRALRSAYPHASISLISLPWATTFIQRFTHYLDEFIEFPGFPGFPERSPVITAFPDFLKLVQSLQFDLALQIHGSGVMSNSILALLGAKKTAGFSLESMFRPDPTTFIDYPTKEHEIWRHLRLLEHLGIPLQGDFLEFPLSDEDWMAYRDIETRYGFGGNELAVVHAGARDPQRRWSADKFAAVADQLIDQGFCVILTGTAEEREVTRDVQSHMSHQPVDLTGLTTYGILGALIASARLVICNDTGISHLAAALRTPSVILFLTSEPQRWAPLNQSLHRRILWANAASPSMVVEKALHLLKKERSYALS